MDDLCEPVILNSPKIDEERGGLSSIMYESDNNDYDPLQDNNNFFNP